MLGEFTEDTYTVKLVSAMQAIVPGAPAFEFYNSLEGAASRAGIGDQAVIDQAKTLLESDQYQTALKIISYIDKGDKILAGVTGIKNVLSLFGGGGGSNKRTFEADPQQALDAGVKALALAYIAYKIIPGEVKEKATTTVEIPAGKELMIYFAAVELALPFTDNVLESGGNVIGKLMDSTGGITQKFGSIAGGGAADQASGLLSSLTGSINQFAGSAGGVAGSLADKIKPYVGGALNVADSASGAAATGADLLPVWTFLGARFVAEAALKEASGS